MLRPAAGTGSTLFANGIWWWVTWGWPSLERHAESFVAEMQTFVESIRAGHEPPVTGRDGRIAVVFANSARR